MPDQIKCPHCKNEDKSMIEVHRILAGTKWIIYLCMVCSKEFKIEGTV